MKGLLFTYVLTYGGAAASLFSPLYGLLIYVCFAVISPPLVWHWSVPEGNYSRIIGIALLVGWAVNGFGRPIVSRVSTILFCLFGYWVWVALSTGFSPNPSLGWPFVEFLAKIVLPVLAGVTLIDKPWKLDALLWTLVASCGFLAYEANLAYYQGVSLATGTFRGLDNNSFSILMVAGYGLTLSLAFTDRLWWRRWACFGMAACMAHVPMLSQSRGGMVGIIAATAAVAYVVPKTRRFYLLSAAALVAGSVLAGPSVIEEFSTTLATEEGRDYSAQSRLDLWTHCADAMIKNPLFGVGQEHWGIYAEKYGWPRGKEAHSLWFQTAAELGVPGLLFLTGFYLTAITASRRLQRTAHEPAVVNAATAVTPGLIGFAVSAAFVTVEGFELPYYIALLTMAASQVEAISVASDRPSDESDEYSDDFAGEALDYPSDDEAGWHRR